MAAGSRMGRSAVMQTLRAFSSLWPNSDTEANAVDNENMAREGTSSIVR